MVSGPPKSVSCVGFEPSALATQISMLPERVDSKAILLPSGENCGLKSTRVEEMKRMGRAEAASHPVRFDATDVMVLYRPGVHQAARLGNEWRPRP